MKRFSVIIPNYNKGIYIDCCINSVLNQTFKDYEIIFIDDGSSDNSLDVVSKYDINIYKTNRLQAGGARNLGISKSNGEYIVFLDSDDYLTNEYVLEKLNNLINGEDIIFLNYTKDNFGEIVEVIEPIEDISLKIEHMKNLGCPTKCFKRDLIKDIRFPECKRFEDIIFTLEATCRAKSYTYFTDSFFTYRRVLNSNASSLIDLNVSIDILEELLKIYRLAVKYPKYSVNLLNRILNDKLNDRLDNLNSLIEAKKILFFMPLIYTGGTEVALLNLVSKLKGYDLYIGYSDNSSDKSKLDLYSKYAHVINLNDDIDINFDYLVSCTSRYHEFDVLNKIKRKKNILWVHYLQSDLSKSCLTIKDKVDELDYVISVSDSLKDDLINIYPLCKDKVITINNVIDTDKIIKDSKVDTNIDLSSKLNLVTVARVCKQKGFDRMYTLANILNNNNIDFKWFIIGDNYYKDKYNEIRDKFKVFDDKFVWLGFMDNPHNIVSKCDYSILLSDYETWGLVITEAMLVGTPCITTNFKASFEQVKDNYNGIILDMDNTDNYNDRINDILNNKGIYKNNIKDFTYNNDNIINKWNDILK